MGSHLSSEHLAQLAPLLGSLARLVAGGSQLSEREIRTLLLGVDLAANPAAMSELRLWATLLHDLQQAPDATQRRATVEALLLRGLPEATVLLAVATVADSGAAPTSPPTVGTTVSPHPPTAPTRLHASVTNLDFGILQPGQTTTLEFDVQGGPGQVVLENDHVQVAPLQFGAGTTHLRVGIKPLASGLLFTSLKLVTAGETLEVPIMAQWQDGGTAPAQLVLGSLGVPPPAPTRQPPPLRQPPQPIVVPQPLAITPAPPIAVTLASGPTPNTPPPRSAAHTIFSAMGLGLGMVLAIVAIVGVGLVFALVQGGLGGAPATAPTAAPAAPTVDVPATATTVAQAAAATAVAQAATETAVAQAAELAALPEWVPTLVEVPAASFIMGSTDQQIEEAGLQQDNEFKSWIQNEKPQHTLTLPTYWIGKTEVTNAQFRHFVEGDGYTNRAYWDDAGWTWLQEHSVTQPNCWDDTNLNSDNQPVICVSWYEAMAYCRWISAQTGQDFRLPTEAEWEKAARGTDGAIYPWGDMWENSSANSNESGIEKTIDVAQYPSGVSPYGALDMAGNAWEWTISEDKPYPYDPYDGRENGSDPANNFFIFRGGSWYFRPIYLRASFRGGGTPVFRDAGVGFRVARYLTIPPTALPAWVPALVEVPAGSFLMGSSDSDTDAQSDEKPQQTVDLPAYSIGKTEVTNAQFRPFVEGDGYSNRDYWTANGWAWRQQINLTQPYYWNDATSNGDNYPVVGVSWYEAVAYCNWLSAKTGMDFRLPTEAEWEKAARGTDGRIYPWGNTWVEGRANSDEAGLRKTSPVGSYPSGASPYGALDMAGNVWEWTSSNNQRSPAERNLRQTDFTEDEQVSLRDGGWYFDKTYARCAARYSNPPHGINQDWGFRVVVSPRTT